jgi:hypothetical protein
MSEIRVTCKTADSLPYEAALADAKTNKAANGKE